MPQKYHYHLVDVFTTQAFGGNQLAVFTEGQNVPESLMPKIAKELNLSEVTFVLPPKDKNNDFWVRIFTPAKELPMAGHPTVGTAYVLAKAGFIDLDEGVTHVKFEEGVGVIPVSVQGKDGEPALITMQQPNPTFGLIRSDRAALAEMLSITEDDLDPNYPIQEVSSGVPFTFIPVKSLDAMRRLSLRQDRWEMLLKDSLGSTPFIFSQEVVHASSTVHSRMFAPAMGIAEDPATGGASGPLGAYLVQYGIVQANPIAQIISEQGLEMGRPSFIHITIEKTDGEFSRVLVGGESVAIGEGYIYHDILLA